MVLTYVVFALRLNTAIFACKTGKNRKFRASKKPNVGFFEQGLSFRLSLFYSLPNFFISGRGAFAVMRDATAAGESMRIQKFSLHKV